MRLNLGSGPRRRDDSVNVDIQRAANPDLCFDLTKRWPLEDESVDEIYAFHVLEHLGPEPEKLITCMCEAYRVCKPGAKMFIEAPNPRSDNWLNDCTHVRPITPSVIAQFDRGVCDKWDGQFGNTPLAKYHNVDWEVVFADATVGEKFAHLPIEKKRKVAAYLNNVIETHRIVVRKR